MQHDHRKTSFVYGGGVMPGRRAGSGVGKYNSDREPKTGQQKDQLTCTRYSKTKQCDLTTLRKLCKRTLGRNSNLGRTVQRQGR